jgi:hypothetical protein
LQEFLKARNILTAPWGKKGLENVRDLELYQPKTTKSPTIKPPKKIVSAPKPLSKEQKYFQQKEKLENKVNKHPKKADLNICYLCLVYFPKEAEIIKSHLAGKKHQKNWKDYQNKQNT